MHTIENQSDSVYTVVFSPDGLFLASGTVDGILSLWNVLNYENIKSFNDEGHISNLCFSNDQTFLA